MLRGLYDWVLSWADSPGGGWALFLLAFSESSFFPVPPDVLLIALGISRPEKALFYALICAFGSVLGGMLGYVIGKFLMDAIGKRILNFYGIMGSFNAIGERFKKHDALAIMVAGFTPIPYKVFTIAAGAFGIHFLRFTAASLISRTARFFLVAFFIMVFGASIRAVIERYFNLFTIIFVALLISGYIFAKKFLKHGA